MLWTVIGAFWRTVALYWISNVAYNIRLHSVNVFGKVIHEFDPYFNFRATEYGIAILALFFSRRNLQHVFQCHMYRYLVDHGWDKFINWYDDRSWYPLGRYARHILICFSAVVHLSIVIHRCCADYWP